jgi:mannose-6-phosphate isomerase-like protein (cupin superfamily)
MLCSRRELAALTALLRPSALLAQEQEHVPSKVYVFDQLPLRHANAVDYRSIVDGKTVDGCRFAVHESALAPNQEPHPPHHHNGEEMFLMIDGMLEVTINGKASRITKGSVAFIGSGDEHGIRNVGDIPAKYFVIELGPQR